MRHTTYSHFCTWNSEIKAILQSDFMQAKDREGSGQPWSQKVKFSFFLINNVCSWTSLISEFQKCHFYFCAMPRNAHNCNLKNDSIQFLGYVFAKNRYIILKFGMPDVQAWFSTYCAVFKDFENFGFCKKLYKNISFLLYGLNSFLNPGWPFWITPYSTAFASYLHFA